MEATHRDLATTHFGAALLALELHQKADEIEETARKLGVTADPAYAIKLIDLGNAYDASLHELGGLELTGSLREAVDDLEASWSTVSLLDLWASPTGSPIPGEELAALVDRLRGLRGQARSVVGAAERDIRTELGRAGRRRQEATRISWAALVAALILGMTALALVVRSVNGPLKRLTRATRAVAGGEFGYRIEAGGGELGRLADDFNRMVERLGELEQLKTELLSRVSHELKTPLVAMHETNQLLLDELPGPLTAKQRCFCGHGLHESHRRLRPRNERCVLRGERHCDHDVFRSDHRGHLGW